VTTPGKPPRFTASPAVIDAWLRQHFAEDVLLAYQQAIGERAVTEATGDLRAAADAPRQLDESRMAHNVRRIRFRQAADRIDPDKAGGPYPSKLLCSRHDGFGECPGAPWCTPRQDVDAAGGEAL
jgi:hypothetical protein